MTDTITYRANGDADGVTRTEHLADIAFECASFCEDNIGEGMDHSPAAIWEGYMSAPGDAVEVPPMPESFPALYMAEVAKLALPDCRHGRKAWESCVECMESA